jgi:polysaccharide chain length determinant protein (PEP-CTERM system associated)
MADETKTGPNLSTLLAVWKRRKWLAILAFAAVFPAGATITMVLPQIYQSSATVLVVGQQVPVDFVRPTVTGNLDTMLQTISQEILRRSRLEELIEKFSLYPSLRGQVSPEALVERMRRDIEIKPTGIDRAGVTVSFVIKYQGRDAQTVAKVTNTLASYYIEENMKVRERQATGTAEFLRVQLTEVKGRLEAQEQRLSDFKRKHLGELPSQLEANLATLERLNTRFRLNGEKQIRVREQRQELARLVESMAALNNTAPVTTTTRPSTTTKRGPGGPVVADANTVRLAKMKQDLADLRTRFSDRYPDVLQLQAEIASLERTIAENKRAAAAAAEAAASTATKDEPAAAAAVSPGPDIQTVQMEQALSQLAVEMKTLKEEENELRTAMATYQGRVDNTPKRDLEFQELSRDYGSTQELYRTLLKRYEEAQLSESLEQRQKGEQFRILEPAVASSLPVAPNRARLMLVSLVLGLGLAVGLVILAEQVDSSFHTLDDLRAITSLPVLVSIPRIVTEADVRRRRRRFQLSTVAAVCGLVLIVSAAYFVAMGNEQLLRMLSPGRF